MSVNEVHRASVETASVVGTPPRLSSTLVHLCLALQVQSANVSVPVVTSSSEPRVEGFFIEVDPSKESDIELIISDLRGRDDRSGVDADND